MKTYTLVTESVEDNGGGRYYHHKRKALNLSPHSLSGLLLFQYFFK
jgi:hypothetical protein